MVAPDNEDFSKKFEARKFMKPQASIHDEICQFITTEKI